MVTRLILAIALPMVVAAQSPEAVRKEIESSYAKAIDALRVAKSIEDLDEINRSFDTQDWQSIVPNQPPRTWAELRKYGFQGLWAPFQSAELQMETFELQGGKAVLTGKLRNVSLNGEVTLVPLKETWKQTVFGWKRQIHQKFLPGETPQ